MHNCIPPMDEGLNSIARARVCVLFLYGTRQKCNKFVGAKFRFRFAGNHLCRAAPNAYCQASVQREGEALMLPLPLGTQVPLSQVCACMCMCVQAITHTHTCLTDSFSLQFSISKVKQERQRTIKQSKCNRRPRGEVTAVQSSARVPNR